jgi:hypothetical protein
MTFGYITARHAAGLLDADAKPVNHQPEPMRHAA